MKAQPAYKTLRLAVTLVLAAAGGSATGDSPQQITTITKRPDGSFQLNCVGAAGATYQLQTATNLQPAVWSAIATNSADTKGIFSFVDTGATNDAMRFYRTGPGVYPPQPGRFPYGLLAKGAISFTNFSFYSPLLDSFSSCNTNYSTGGLYDPAKATDQLIVATDSSASPAIQVGTAKIYGYVETGSTGTVSLGTGGSVGDSAWVNGGMTGVEPGHATTNANVPIPDATVPFTSGATPFNGMVTVNGTNYTSTLTSATNYFNGNYYIVGGQSMVITNNAWFYVTGNFTINGSGLLYVAPGASLNLYVGTTNASDNTSVQISGFGAVNGTGYAANLSIVGLPSVKTVTYAGAAGFIGSIYCPEAAATLSGHSDCIGAVLANTITLIANFHYDACLGVGTGP